MADNNNSARIQRRTFKALGAYHTHGDNPEPITVAVAARVLGVTERRVRSFINPQCNCVERNRRNEGKGFPDESCPTCHGSGRGKARLAAIKIGSVYLVKMTDLIAFKDISRISGKRTRAATK
jgi:hypothetical protein